MKIIFSQRIEAIKQVELDTPQEGVKLALALGRVAVDSFNTNRTQAEVALGLQGKLVGKLINLHQEWPMTLEIDDSCRSYVHGSLNRPGMPKADECITDRQSLVLAEAVRYLPHHEEVIIDKTQQAA